MPRLAAKIGRANYAGPYRAFGLAIDRRLELAALEATDQAAKLALRSIRAAMQGAGLGRLGNGLGSASDLSSGRGIHRRGADAWSASGVVFVRSRSARTRGAIEAYTGGADIRPTQGRWLWIATDQIPSKAGRFAITPELYVKTGLEQRIGKLIFLKSVNGRPLLAVENVGVAITGQSRSARSLKRNGTARKGQIAKQLVIAFVGIPRTSRAARVDVQSIMRAVQADLPRLAAQALEKVSS
ncbi:hypothetical protein GGQ88_003514 [Novosphingobium hassiacum]|uniref:Uncharacterized protein n=1 Tax=Novosphingobium hassiacum TaxID=173676 RepID=A0A7W6EXE7_9SPHN|nr:hypothetical protein [Novosphingobium hassiacum]MBB3862216.1 hypothetical protein [Novosphingobium hassiacum]